MVKARQDVSVTARVLSVPKATLGNWVRLADKGELQGAGDRPGECRANGAGSAARGTGAGEPRNRVVMQYAARGQGHLLDPLAYGWRRLEVMGPLAALHAVGLIPGIVPRIGRKLAQAFERVAEDADRQQGRERQQQQRQADGRAAVGRVGRVWRSSCDARPWPPWTRALSARTHHVCGTMPPRPCDRQFSYPEVRTALPCG